MHKHAADLGGLVGAAHPAFDAGIGAARGTGSRKIGREVARAEADQRIVGVERGDDQLAHLALGHRVAGSRAHDLHDHALVQNQAFARAGFIGNEAQIGRAVALVCVDAMLAHPLAE